MVKNSDLPGIYAHILASYDAYDAYDAYHAKKSSFDKKNYQKEESFWLKEAAGLIFIYSVFCFGILLVGTKRPSLWIQILGLSMISKNVSVSESWSFLSSCVRWSN